MKCEDFYWHNDSVSGWALHNLTSSCPSNSSMNFEAALLSPATFFIQLVRLSLSLTILTLVSVLYNCVNVLDRNVLSTATCSLYWIIYLSFTAVKATILMILLPLAKEGPYYVNLVGFVLTSLIQTGLTYVLFMALDHERRYRSPDFATFDSPGNRCCVGLKPSKLVCSKWRVGVLLLSLLPVALLIALEIVFAVHSSNHEVPDAPAALAWVYMVSVLCVRVVVLATIVYIVLFTKGNCEPTIIAKVYLLSAAVLSLFEDLPNSLLAVSVHQPRSCHDLYMEECLVGVMTIYDLAQLIGAFSLVFYALFVRSQYLRIEEECKLVLVWDMQKLLQVNGRKDSIRHYT